MDELIQQMKIIQASVFAFYLKAHNFHWNVEGPNFPQYHSFFEMIYTDAWVSVDRLAEEIRTLDSYVPGSLSRFKSLSVVEDQWNIPTAINMIKELRSDNLMIISELDKTQLMSDKAKCPGLTNFLQERIDIHFKNDWMMRSIVKGQ